MYLPAHFSEKWGSTTNKPVDTFWRFPQVIWCVGMPGNQILGPKTNVLSITNIEDKNRILILKIEGSSNYFMFLLQKSLIFLIWLDLFNFPCHTAYSDTKYVSVIGKKYFGEKFKNMKNLKNLETFTVK